jgi:hypothetical protein
MRETASELPPHDRRSLTICGSGNAAHALAVVASQNFDGDIDWLVGSVEKAQLLRRSLFSDGLHSTGVIAATAERIRTVSADPADVIPNADIVLIVVPAFAHAAVLRRIGPHVRPTTAVGCMPTRAGFEFDAANLLACGDDERCPSLFGTQTLPWSTRVTAFGRAVHIGAAKEEVVLAALPAADGPRIAAYLSPILGTRVITTHSFLGLTLGNPGQVIHPGIMYGHFRAWHGEEYDQSEIPMLYAGATEEIGEVVGRLSADSRAVAEAIETRTGGALKVRSAVLPIHDWLRNVYGRVTADPSTIGSCFRTGPIRARKAPTIEVKPGRFTPDFSYRYLSEDVPYGLVATRALAELAEVPTPAIDEVLAWAQSVLRKVYLVSDRLDGRDARELPLPQNHGVASLSDLVAWYREHDALRSSGRREVSKR